MKHHAKVVGYKNDIITLKVDGRYLSYFVSRPQPLGPADVALLRGAMDTRLLESMFDLVTPRRGILSWFHGLWRHKDKIPQSYEAIADYIEDVGVEVDISEKAKALVILRSCVDDIRRGEIQ